MSKLRILIADDHAVVRAGIRTLLEKVPDCEVCAEATNGREAVALTEKQKFDLVILDITMPELNGLEATRQILMANPDIRVLILSMHESEQMVREIIAAGAHGYVLKSDASDQLAIAVQTLRQRKQYFTAKVAQIELRSRWSLGGPNDPPPTTGYRLTTREREVLQLLAEGKANKQVAEALGINIKTVESHRDHVMKKLKLHSSGELFHYAARNKIIVP